MAIQVSEPPSVRFVGVSFDRFLEWSKWSWEPGKHLALVGPTGEGKTTFASHLLRTRKWVLALDPKGEDETLTESGFMRVTRLPLKNKIRNTIADGQPARLIIGGSSRNDKEQSALKALMADAVRMCREQGGWTIYADEYQVLADLRMFGLGKRIEELLITARRHRTSVVTSFQAPAWVPKAALRQAWGTAIWPTRDVDMIQSVARSMGRPHRELQEAVHQLPPYHIIFIPKSVFAPMIITSPPKL